jgi:uncharacterized membrane protein
MRSIGFYFVIAIFLVGGIAHFAFLNLFESVVPSYIPFPKEVVLFTGVCEVVGAIALLFQPLRQLTGWVFAFYLLCAWPVHFDMLAHADRWKELGPTFLWVRLLLQPVLMAAVVVVTRPNRVRGNSRAT